MKMLPVKLGITGKTSLFNLIKQFIKFGIVGVSNTLIALAVYYALVYLGINYIIANVASFVISVCNAYFWNSRYVFTKNNDNQATQFMKSCLSYFSTFLLSTTLLFCLVGVLHISKWIAPLISLCFTIPLNFLLNKFWAFR